MKFKPHDYQQHAITYLHNHPTAALILEMGLGKTIITLTALQQMLHQRFTAARPLVIAPLRVARDTWPEELNKWDHLQDLTMAVMVGTASERRAALTADADIWVINRENLPWLVKELDGQWPFDTVIIDELSSFKSHTSQRFKALKRVRPHIRRIIGLTGTPAPNNLLDLWAPFRLLDQGERLGTHIGHYRSRFFVPGKRNGHIVYEWKLSAGAEDDIYEQIGDITLSMKAIDHLDMPPITFVDRTIPITGKALTTYRELRDTLVADLEDDVIIADNAGVLAGKLQQLAAGAIYTDDSTDTWTEIHDVKLEALDDIIEEAQGQNILVAFWFKHDLARLQERYPHGRLLDREEDMTAWKNGELPLAFIHPASAGHGLNLQSGGHILVWFTPTWSLELYQQTNARLYRQGQTQPVTVIRLLATPTIDARIAAVLAAKDGVQSALIEAVKAELEDGR